MSDPGRYDVDLSGRGDKTTKIRRFTQRLDRVGGIVASEYVGHDGYLCLVRIFVAPEQVRWIEQWPGVRSVMAPPSPDLGPSTGDDSESEAM